MKCVLSFEGRVNPYAMAVHHAAHAFAAVLFGMNVTEITTSYGGRQGTFVAQGVPLIERSIEHTRQAAEKRAIVLLAGGAAQLRGTGNVPSTYESRDQAQVFDLLGAIEPEEPVASAWFAYLHERTRVLVEKELAWRPISEIAGALLLRGILAGDDVYRIASAFSHRRNAVPSNAIELPVLGRWPTL